MNDKPGRQADGHDVEIDRRMGEDIQLKKKGLVAEAKNNKAHLPRAAVTTQQNKSTKSFLSRNLL